MIKSKNILMNVTEADKRCALSAMAFYRKSEIEHPIFEIPKQFLYLNLSSHATFKKMLRHIM